MPLTQVLVVLIVVGVVLWLVNLIPMQGTIKSILNTIVVIFVVVWLLNVFGLMPYLSQVHVGNFRL
jgi:ABC-type siderophore export system fused ATPase/permease subunit